MLLLSRKVGEEIIINGEIRVTVVRVQGSRVQIGINAPPNVPIRRRELSPRGVPTPPAAEPFECAR